MKLIRTPDLELAQITQVILTPKTRQKWTRRLQQRTQPDLSPKAGVSSTHREAWQMEAARCFLSNELLHV